MQTTVVNFTEQDAEAVHAVRAGDAERYRELVERHKRRVFAVAWSRLGDAALAEDVTQEAFIRAYRGLWLLGDGAKFAGWINAIARNVAVNFGIRRRRELNKRERWVLEQAAPGEALPQGNGAEAPCTLETLRQTLAELPDVHRECLVLFHLEGKSGAEAAAALGISEAALRVRLHRARAALRERLEERLADSLRKLGPAKTLVPAVMAGVLATSSAKAATASGAGTTILGTLVKLSPLKLLLTFSAAAVAMLPSMALTALAARAEQRNFRDPAGFRAQMSRRIHRTVLWVVPLTVIPFVIGTLMLIGKLGHARSDWILAVIMIGCFAWAWRMFGGYGRLQRGMMIWYGMLTGGMVLKAAGLLPPTGLTWVFIAATLWLMWIQRWQPTRMDYSLFFRAMMGMLENPPPGAPATTPAARLEKSDLKRFGKFLADRNLVNGFRWRPEGLVRRQGFVKPSWPMNKAAVFKAAFPLATRDSSNVLLHWNGEVSAQISERDDRTQRMLKPEEAAQRAKIQTQVAAAATRAWQAFRQGDIAAADRALGEQPDSEIFRVPPARSAAMRWRQASLGLVVLLFLGMMLAGKYPQLLSPIFGRHANPATPSTAALKPGTRSRATPLSATNALLLQADSASNAPGATNQLPQTRN